MSKLLLVELTEAEWVPQRTAEVTLLGCLLCSWGVTNNFVESISLVGKIIKIAHQDRKNFCTRADFGSHDCSSEGSRLLRMNAVACMVVEDEYVKAPLRATKSEYRRTTDFAILPRFVS